MSQAYLALLETGRRRVTDEIASRIARVYRLGPVTLPLETDGISTWDSARLARALASLGYPGFPHVRGARRRNPAVILLVAIAAGDLEVRVIEALPWLIVENSDLDWDWLIREAKVRDVQNRLGFLVTLARQAADKRGDVEAARRLRETEQALDRARLIREDTLCQDSLTYAERRWLRRARSSAGRHWNLLTDLDSDDLRHVA